MAMQRDDEARARARTQNAEREEAEISALLHHLDHAPPRIDASAVAAIARTPRIAWSRWAAAIVLALGAAGSALAASGWVRSALDGENDAPARPAPASASPEQPDAPVAGIAVAPGSNLLILFSAVQAEGRASISLGDGSEVAVRVVGAAPPFTSDDGRLVIDNTSAAADFEIQVPSDAPRVEIRVAGRRVFLKEGAHVTADVIPDSRGVYIFSLTAVGL
jgi:hypothetical protein